MRNIKNKKAMKNKAQSNVHAVILTRLFKVYSILFVLFFVALFLYLYFMFASIYETALRKDYNIKSVNLKSEIAEKEAQILSIKENVNIAQAVSSGEFVKVKEDSKEFAKVQVYLGMAR